MGDKRGLMVLVVVYIQQGPDGAQLWVCEHLPSAILDVVNLTLKVHFTFRSMEILIMMTHCITVIQNTQYVPLR